MDTTVPSPDAAAATMLAEVLYADLMRIARRERRRGVSTPATLGTTALVHEAYLKLSRKPAFESEAHFLNTAAVAMRQVLVTYARGRLRHKRGEGVAHEDIDSIDILAESDEQIVALDEALVALASDTPRLASIVECRYFAGYSEAETAAVLGISERTVQRDWTLAKAVLYDLLTVDP
jgi:RNA polymerase sigma factor (TIGR02999 family)